MARPISWLPRLHAIRVTVKNSVISHFSSRDLTRIFQLQPAAARKLLAIIQTDEVGTSHLVSREVLLKFLDQAQQAEDVTALVLKQRASKEGTSRKRLRILMRPDDLKPVEVGEISLPTGLELRRGHLGISFETREELLEAFIAVTRMIESDSFARLYLPLPPPAPPVDTDLLALHTALTRMRLNAETASPRE